MAFDRDDMTIFSYDTMSEAVADGIEKYAEKAKEKDEGKKTAADVMLTSSAASADSEAGLMSLISIVRDMAGDISAMKLIQQQHAQSDNNTKGKTKTAAEKPDGSNKNSKDKDRSKDKDDGTVMQQTKKSREFFSDLGLNDISKSIATWSSMFDRMGKQVEAVSKLSDFSKAMSNTDKHGLSALSAIIDKAEDKAEDKEDSKTDDKAEDKADKQQDGALHIAGPTTVIVMSGDLSGKLSKYIEDRNVKNEQLEALASATSIADSVMGNTTGPADTQPKSSWDTEIMNALGLDRQSSKSSGLSGIIGAASDGLQLADTLSGGKVSSAIGGAASKVLGKGVAADAVETAAGAAGATEAAAAGAAGGSGMLSTILGAGSKIAGPIAVLAGIASWGMGQYRSMNRLGNIQGDGAGTGLGYKIEDIGQDLMKTLGLTDVSGRDLDQFRSAASKAGFNMGTDEANAAIDVQKYAKNNGIDPNAALNLSRTVIEAGGSAEDVKDQFEELKDTASDLGVDFATLSEAAASTSSSLRKAGSENEHAGTEVSEEMTELLKRSGFDNVEAGDIASVANSPLFRQAVAQMAVRNGDTRDVYAVTSSGDFAMRYLTEHGGKNAIQQAYNSTLGYVGQMTTGMGSKLSQEALMSQLAGQFAGMSPDSGSKMFNDIRSNAEAGITINMTNTIGTGTQDQIQANAIRSNGYYGNGQSNVTVNNNGARR